MAVDKKMMWAFGGLCVLVLGAVGLMVFTTFHRPKVAAPENVALSIPDGEVRPMESSKSAAMRGAVTLDKYFEELGEELGEEDVSLVSSTKEVPVAPVPDVAERPEAAVTRVFGAPDGERPAVSGGRSGGGMSREERLAYDRQRAEMVREVLTGASVDSVAAPGNAVQPRQEAIRFVEDDIVTYLDDVPLEEDEVGVRPFRCMFVRDEKVSAGQRVMLRLLEELPVEGVVIPANAHLSAICKIGDRLELTVGAVEYGGRIVPVELDAYDADGLPGIYCPETVSGRGAKRATEDALSVGTRTVGGLVGDIASTVIRTGASIVKSASGEVKVAVTSGYEFYLVKK